MASELAVAAPVTASLANVYAILLALEDQPERLADLLTQLIAAHPDTVFGLHICRGNDANRYMAKGGYGEIARELFARTRAQRLLLKYDDERSYDFAPLAEVPDDRFAVLGLITTKYPREKSREEIEARVGEAARYIDMVRLTLSIQCGFASVAKGNNLSFALQEIESQPGCRCCLRPVAGLSHD